MINESDFFVLTSDLIKRTVFICVLVVIFLFGLINGQVAAE